MNCDADLELGVPQTAELELGDPRSGHTRTGKTELELGDPWIGF